MPGKILIVDDDEINVMLLEEILKKDYEIIKASNGVDALSSWPRISSL